MPALSRPSGEVPRFTILLVEDDRSLRELIAEMLVDEGYAVRAAANVDEATRILGVQAVQFILSDIRMPLKSGLDLFRWCLHSGITTHGRPTPFAFMTGFTDLLDIAEAKRLGACGFISKPFQVSELRGLLAKELVTTVPIPAESLFFAPVPLREFRGGRDGSHPLFVETAVEWPETGLRVPRKVGDWTGGLRDAAIAELEANGIHRFLMRTGDFSRYVGFSGRADRFARGEILERGEPFLSTIQDASVTLSSRFSEGAGGGSSLRTASDIVDASLKSLLELKSTSDQLVRYRAADPAGFARSVRIATIAVGTALRQNGMAVPALARLAVAALIAPWLDSKSVETWENDLPSESAARARVYRQEIQDEALREEKQNPQAHILYCASAFDRFVFERETQRKSDFRASLRAFGNGIHSRVPRPLIDATILFLSEGVREEERVVSQIPA